MITGHNDLICDTCPEKFDSRGDLLVTFEYARVAGWHIYQRVQASFSRSTGASDVMVTTSILCPACVGSPRSHGAPPPKVLEGQADILEDLDHKIVPVRKDTGHVNKREMS